MRRLLWKSSFVILLLALGTSCGPQPMPADSPAQPPPSEDGTKIPQPGSPAAAPGIGEPSTPGSPSAAASGSGSESSLSSGSGDWFAELGIPAPNRQGRAR